MYSKIISGAFVGISAYLVAVEDMFAYTDTAASPWTVVAAEDKKFARLQILRHITDKIDTEATLP